MMYSKRHAFLFFLVVLAAALVWLDADTRTRVLLLNTLKLCSAVVAISVPIGTILSVLISRSDIVGRSILQTILTAMLFVPLYLQAAGWDAGFGRQGWLSLSSETVGQPWLSGFHAAVWTHSMAAIPWVSLLINTALRHIDPELEEAASLTQSISGVVLRVTLPMITPAMAAATLWTTVLVAGEITVTDLYQFRTYAEEVYTMVPLLDESLEPASGGVSLPKGVLLMSLLLIAGALVAVTILRQPIGSHVRPPLQLPLEAWRIPATILTVIAMLVIVGVPLANLVYNAGMQVVDNAGQLERHWSVTKASSLIMAAPSRFSRELQWSGLIGATSATLCMVVAVPLAWLGRRGHWRVLPAVAFVAAGAAIPGPVLGLWIIRLLSQPDSDTLAWLYDHTILAPVLATSIRALPAAVLATWYGIQSLSPDLMDAASVDGLSLAGRLYRVILPARRSALAGAWLIAFIVAAGELSASILVTPPGLFTTPVRVFGLLHAGVDDQVAGLCLANLAFMVIIQVGAARLLGRP